MKVTDNVRLIIWNYLVIREVIGIKFRSRKL